MKQLHMTTCSMHSECLCSFGIGQLLEAVNSRPQKCRVPTGKKRGGALSSPVMVVLMKHRLPRHRFGQE